MDVRDGKRTFRLFALAAVLLFSLIGPACRSVDPSDYLYRQDRIGISATMRIAEAERRHWGVRHFEAGRADSAAGDMGSAFRHFSAAAAMMPDWDLPQLELAVLHPLWDNDLAAQLAALERAAAINPNNPRTRMMLGIALAQAGHADAAEEHLKAAIAMRNDLPEARLRLGNLYQREQRPEKAIEQFEILIEQSPQNTSLHATLADLYENSGSLERAERHLLALCRLNPDRAWAFLKLSGFYARHGRTQQAQEALEKARDLTPGEKRRKTMRPLLPSKR